jgi:LysR family transcriptional regulator, hydrogen peroxide-inducible genes activator
MNNKRPSIRQLEYFVAVARASNFRKAAEKLGLSQPALTQQIADLEKLLDLQLFDRSRAGTLLSPAGRNLLPLAREILDQFHLLEDLSTLSRSTGLVGTFHLGVAPTIAPTLLPKVIPVLYERYRELKLHVTEHMPGMLEAGLDAGEFDLILTVLPMQSGRHRIRPLFSERLKLVMHVEHPLARKSSLRGRDLHQQDIIGFSQHLQLQKQTQALCDRYGAHLLREMEANSLASLRLMLLMNMGIAIVPELFLQTAMVDEPGLKSFVLEDEALARTHVAVWRKQSSARQQFQKLSFEIKAIAMETCGDYLEEVLADENLPETW